MLTMKYNKDLETFNFQAFFERRRRRNRENGIKRKVDRMLKEERMDIIIGDWVERSKREDMFF